MRQSSGAPWRAGLMAGALVLACSQSQVQAQAAPKAESQDISKIAEDAYVFGYPLVLMDVTKQQLLATTGTPVNEFSHAGALANANDRVVVRPNVDTLYSTAWLDLSKEPVVLHVPATDRYYLMPMLDAYTNVFAAPGPRTTGKGAQDFVIVGPNYKGAIPKNMKRIDAPTSMVWILGRVQVNGAADLAAASKDQLKFSLRSPSAVQPPTQKSGGVAALGGGKAADVTPPAQIAKMNPQAYFDRMLSLMKQNPPAKADGPALAKFAAIGIKQGELFTPPPQYRDAIQAAIPRAQKRIAEKVNQLDKPQNGWQFATKDIGSYGTHYDRRAAIALAGLGANLAADAVYPMTTVDSENQPLTGKKRYTLHFSKENLPPAKAFWSLTMYDDKGYLVGNAIDRYALGDRDKMLYNRDGSLDILIQHDAPSAEKNSNWLPAPEGPFNLALRLYSPKPEVTNGQWVPPAVRLAETPARPAAAR
jgi:hypothetical protein